MPIEVKCQCGKMIRANDDLAGQTIQCMLCRRLVVVPDPALLPPPVPVGSDAQPVPQVSNRSTREYLYCLLALALFPLAFALGEPKQPTFSDRLNETLAECSQEVRQRVYGIMNSQNATIDAVLAALPGNRLRGAHLPRNTSDHLLYGVLSGGGFWTLFLWFFARGSARAGTLLLVGLFTGTIGIALLLLAQNLGIVYLLVGSAMTEAEGGAAGFLRNWAVWTFGVGLVEELCKLAPLVWLYHRTRAISWRQAALWGLASGVGFGVNEGIFYSAGLYNGIEPASEYVIRFVSCVALHAAWCASAAIAFSRYQFLLKEMNQWYEYALVLPKVLAVPMVLHGLYDAALTQELNFLAMLSASISFAWLIWQVESTRKKEMEVASPSAKLLVAVE